MGRRTLGVHPSQSPLRLELPVTPLNVVTWHRTSVSVGFFGYSARAVNKFMAKSIRPGLIAGLIIRETNG